MQNEDVLRQQFMHDYWDYYLEIERDVQNTFRYVEPDKPNFRAYSREYKNLLDSIGSEVDVVGKSIAELHSPNDTKLKKAPIPHWGFMVQQAALHISDASVSFGAGIQITPWRNWRNEQAINKAGNVIYRLEKGAENPEWWRAYNRTKHRRKSLARPNDSSYERANLENVLAALAGLYLLELLLGVQVGVSVIQLMRASALFSKTQFEGICL